MYASGRSDAGSPADEAKGPRPAAGYAAPPS